MRDELAFGVRRPGTVWIKTDRAERKGQREGEGGRYWTD